MSGTQTWQAALAAFERWQDAPDPAALLAEIAAEDAALAARVRGLIEADRQAEAGNFLAQPVQAEALRDAQLVVALDARVLIDALARRVAVAAVLVALERRVPLRERTRREELRGGDALEAEHDRERTQQDEELPHSKIHRNP